MTKRTVNLSETKLYRAYTRFEERGFAPIKAVAEGKVIDLHIKKEDAEYMYGLLDELDTQLMETSTAHAVYVMAVCKMQDLIEEFGLDTIKDHVFEEQRKAFKTVLADIATLTNYYKKEDDGQQQV